VAAHVHGMGGRRSHVPPERRKNGFREIFDNSELGEEKRGSLPAAEKREGSILAGEGFLLLAKHKKKNKKKKK